MYMTCLHRHNSISNCGALGCGGGGVEGGGEERGERLIEPSGC